MDLEFVATFLTFVSGAMACTLMLWFQCGRNDRKLVKGDADKANVPATSFNATSSQRTKGKALTISEYQESLRKQKERNEKDGVGGSRRGHSSRSKNVGSDRRKKIKKDDPDKTQEESARRHSHHSQVPKLSKDEQEKKEWKDFLNQINEQEPKKKSNDTSNKSHKSKHPKTSVDDSKKSKKHSDRSKADETCTCEKSTHLSKHNKPCPVHKESKYAKDNSNKSSKKSKIDSKLEAPKKPKVDDEKERAAEWAAFSNLNKNVDGNQITAGLKKEGSARKEVEEKEVKRDSKKESKKSKKLSGRTKNDEIRVEKRGADEKRSLSSFKSERTQSDVEHDASKMSKIEKEWKQLLNPVNDESKENSKKTAGHKPRKGSKREHGKNHKEPEGKSKVANEMTRSAPKSKKDKKKSKKDSTKVQDKSTKSTTSNRNSKERLNNVRRKLRNSLYTQTESGTKQLPTEESQKPKTLPVPHEPSRSSRRKDADAGSLKSKGKSKAKAPKGKKENKPI